MSELIGKIGSEIEKIALEVVTLENGDIPAMGDVMNRLCFLEEKAGEIKEGAFNNLVSALKGYLEKLILSELDDMGPFEEGIEKLQSIHRAMVNEEPFRGDIHPLLKKLGFNSKPNDKGEEVQEEATPEIAEGEEKEPQTESTDAKEEPAAESFEESSQETQELSEEDRQILQDFVVESLENLGTIEVSLIDLEQDPTDAETINAIFRPFHTIKGVSGFLNLDKINKLAHSAENLLDKARNGEIRVEGMVIDLILESVDMLKKMIEGVQDALETGGPLDAGIDIGPLVKRINDAHSGEGDKPLGEILVNKGAVAKEDVEEGLSKQKEEPDKKIGGILVEEKKTGSKEVISALREQKRYNRRHIDLQVKVDTKKLDNLVDLTGELVISQAMLRQNEWVRNANDQKLFHTLNQLNQITSSLQRTAMSLRMIPIKSTFQKMVRLVRDLAKNSGKEVGLEMSGEETEIDRNVVDELYEPMVHMIRNAVDHGIEMPDEREKAGKDRKGTIFLKAYHRGGNIIIEIKDNGRGLDKARILEKARSSNLITDEDQLTESEIYNLIFRPGFSTAQKVTDISGRGVGMDVVKRAIEKLRGRVEINSIPGEGSTFVISLPLTLAIIEGMVVRVGKERYIIPALAILESFRPQKDQYSTVEGKGELILSRGRLIPLIRLDRVFGVQGDSVHPWDGLVVAVESDGEQRCLLLDELLGKEEVVIKSLGESLKHTKGIAGGAIMGDGRVGLILDISGLFEIAQMN
ncbi:MAG: chemotaxis protein CheA [Deltaproteobacteria bacterium]|nr:chemotaxis protein CheA [Deltaproteobacteria bacterium]